MLSNRDMTVLASEAEEAGVLVRMLTVAAPLQDTVVSIVLTLLLGIVFIVSSVLNTVFLIIYCRRPSLRSISNRFILSLVVSNLLASSVLLPLVLVDAFSSPGGGGSEDTITSSLQRGHEGRTPLHQALTALADLVASSSIFATVLIAVDRFCAITDPLHYHMLVTRLKSVGMITGAWLLTFVIAGASLMTGISTEEGIFYANTPAVIVSEATTPPSSSLPILISADLSASPQTTSAPTLETSPPSDMTSSPRDMTSPSSSMTSTSRDVRSGEVVTTAVPYLSPSTSSFYVWGFQSVFTIVNAVVSFAVPMVLLIWIYVRIYRAAHKNSERTRRNSLCGAALDAVDPGRSSSRSVSRTPSTRSTSSQIVTNLRHRISNASLFLHKEESRAAKISVVVIVLFFACWLPYYAAQVLDSPLLQVSVPRFVHHLTLVLALSNAAVSPYLYLFRSRRIQREVRRLLGWPLSSSSNNKGALRRRHQNQLFHRLDAIPPSPTVPNGDFELVFQCALESKTATPDGGAADGSLLTLLNKMFRPKALAKNAGLWNVHRDSITSTTSSSMASSTTASSTANSLEASSLCGENEHMLPKEEEHPEGGR